MDHENSIINTIYIRCVLFPSNEKINVKIAKNDPKSAHLSKMDH